METQSYCPQDFFPADTSIDSEQTKPTEICTKSFTKRVTLRQCCKCSSKMSGKKNAQVTWTLYFLRAGALFNLLQICSCMVLSH